MLIGATVAGREKVEVNPTTKLSRAIQGDKGILLIGTNYACPESWSTRFAQVETSLKRFPKPTFCLRGGEVVTVKCRKK